MLPSRFRRPPLASLIASALCCAAVGCGDSEGVAAGPWGTTHDASTGDAAADDVSADSAVEPDGAVELDVAEPPDGSVQVEGGNDGCPPGAIACGAECVDPATDPNHCGGCWLGCAAGEECKAGLCTAAACDDTCSPQGAKECSGSGVRECAMSTVIDGCLEWSPVTACASGTACDPASATCKPPCGDDCDPFSLVLLPDTQYYTSKQSNTASNTYRKQMQWIIDHEQSDNIRFVLHMGDITNSNATSEWTIADAAHDMLDAKGIPYSVAPGNHDYLTSGGWDRGGSQFDTWFGKSRFSSKPWYGGSYGSSNTNNYVFFEVGKLKFMALSLEYSPRKEVLCWAEDVIAQHPDHRVIIATHCYMTNGGGYSTGCPDADYAALGATGADVWKELASRHSNVFLVVSGHVGASEYKVTNGNNGNPVHQMVVDYQFEGACSASNPADCNRSCRVKASNYTGNGWMRKLVFDPVKNTVHAETFTVEKGNKSLFPNGTPTLFCSELFDKQTGDSGGNYYSKDPAHADHQYDFPYDMGASVPYARDDQGKRAFIDRTANSAGAGNQLAPEIAISPSDSFVAVWQDDSSPDDGDGNHDIMARGFSAGGCSGFKDVVVNPTTTGHQLTPAVAMDSAGRFVVVWTDDADDNGVYQIHGRGFNADGTERIARFTVNSVDTGQQRNPAIAMAPDGRFVVAWEDDPDKDGNYQVMVRGFSANGAQSFSDRSVHTDAVGTRLAPAIAMDASANFVVAWQDDSDGNGSYQIHMRGFDAAGNERFARKTVNTVDDGQQRNPSIGMASSGTFVVAWEDDPESDGTSVILARGFQATGSQSIADFRVHSATGGHHLEPSVSIPPKGGFVIGWQDDADGNGTWQIRARSFKADGSQWMAERTINTVAAGQQRAPRFALGDSGALVAIWEDDMDGNDAYQLVTRGFDSP